MESEMFVFDPSKVTEEALERASKSGGGHTPGELKEATAKLANTINDSPVMLKSAMMAALHLVTDKENDSKMSTIMALLAYGIQVGVALTEEQAQKAQLEHLNCD